jgi:hypothetical protein
MEAAVTALLSEPTQEAAAAKVGVHKDTLRRWKQLPVFKRALRTARLNILEQVGDPYLQMGKRAAIVIYESMHDESPPVIRLRAAEDVNDAIKELVGLVQVKEELAELRAMVEEKHHASGAVSSANGRAAGRDRP